MEFWDIFDRNRKALGRTVHRGTPLGAGEYHLAVSIWTVNHSGCLLLTLRSPEKRSFPNLWENTAGSVLAGEDSRTAAVRELYEETGIRVLPQELCYLGTQFRPHAFVDTYAVRHDIPLDAIVLQAGETADARWVTVDELKELVQLGVVARPVTDQLKRMEPAFSAFLSGRPLTISEPQSSHR